MDGDVLERTDEWRRSVLDSLGVSASAVGVGGASLTIALDTPVALRRIEFAPRLTASALDALAIDDDADTGVVLEAVHGRDAYQPPRRPPSRRDSLKRREALLRGKEGSRQRRRWENDRLLHVPNAQPPLPSDYVAQPTHPVHHNVPYHLTPYWDRGLRQHTNETRAAAAVLRRNQIVARQTGLSVEVIEAQAKVTIKPKARVRPTPDVTPQSTSEPAPASQPAPTSRSGAEPSTAPAVMPASFGTVPRHLRAAAKKTYAVKLWVRVLEEPIRQYLHEAEKKRRQADEEQRRAPDRTTEDVGRETHNGDDADDADDTDDDSSGGCAFSDHEDEDDILTTGRRQQDAALRAASWERAVGCVAADGAPISRDGIVFDDLGDGDAGSFKQVTLMTRWLAHSLSDYYGLTSTSMSVGAPPKRVVCVALRYDVLQPGGGPVLIPRPLWEAFEGA